MSRVRTPDDPPNKKPFLPTVGEVFLCNQGANPRGRERRRECPVNIRAASVPKATVRGVEEAACKRRDAGGRTPDDPPNKNPVFSTHWAFSFPCSYLHRRHHFFSDVDNAPFLFRTYVHPRLSPFLRDPRILFPKEFRQKCYYPEAAFSLAFH